MFGQTPFLEGMLSKRRHTYGGFQMSRGNFLHGVMLFCQSKREQLIIVFVVLAVAVGAAIILGPHIDSNYNNIIPSGSE